MPGNVIWSGGRRRREEIVLLRASTEVHTIHMRFWHVSRLAFLRACNRCKIKECFCLTYLVVSWKAKFRNKDNNYARGFTFTFHYHHRGDPLSYITSNTCVADDIFHYKVQVHWKKKTQYFESRFIDCEEFEQLKALARNSSL